MWVFLNDSFLSIVQHREKPGAVLVRARAAGDIEKVFSQAETWTDRRADYPFRAVVSKEEAAEAMAAQVRGIDYDNFKNSVLEGDRYAAYSSIWERMLDWAEGRGEIGGKYGGR